SKHSEIKSPGGQVRGSSQRGPQATSAVATIDAGAERRQVKLRLASIFRSAPSRSRAHWAPRKPRRGRGTVLRADAQRNDSAVGAAVASSGAGTRSGSIL